ncbi:hypothetical protein JTE90_018484 [Oedothorax gibbosus]|uniref:Gem-associated protein 2 n=1 Tax=Oedothorax gibbosus TaxID=931172 RepID=A0AAV6UFN7_9ARAC|nr:hypothetical protein JTE90_018484 [Oedothorax gibbosus]
MSEKNSRKAFDIGRIPKNLDLSSPPVTGFDYLYRVRLETRKCPKVVVSNIDTTKFLSRQTVQVDPFNGFVRARPGFEPDPAWQDDQLDTFITTRTEVFQNREEMKKKFPKRNFPKITDEQGWCLFCLGSTIHQKVFTSGQNKVETTDNAQAHFSGSTFQRFPRESTADSLGAFVSKKSTNDSSGVPHSSSTADSKLSSDSQTLISNSSNTMDTSEAAEESSSSVIDRNFKKNLRTQNSQSTTPDSEPKSKRSRCTNPDVTSDGHPPLLSIVLRLNQTRITRLLAFHLNWLDTAGYSDAQGRWLYALLMCLEKPLDPGDCAMLRSLSRKCSRLRSEIVDPKDGLVLSINLVLSIISRFFDQKDMSDGFLVE